MKKKLLLLLSFFGMLSVNAQEFNSVATFSMTKPLISIAPRLHFGYIRRLDQRFLIGAEVGFGAGKFGFLSLVTDMNDGSGTKNYLSFEVAPELYFQLNPNSQSILMFASGEVFYTYHRQNLNNIFYEYNFVTNQEFTAESVDYERQKYGFNINFSTFFPIGEKWGIMPKTGLGILGRNVTYTNPVNITSDYFHQNEAFFLDPTAVAKQKGNYVDVSVRFDVKLVYKF